MFRQIPLKGALALLTAVGIAPASFAEAPNACLSLKMRASTKAFNCTLRERAKELRGKTIDLTRCEQKLAGSFAKAEAVGGCTTTGDLAIASPRVAAAVESVLDDLQAGTVSEAELRCLLGKAKLTQRYATCQAAALGKRLAGTYQNLTSDFQACEVALDNGFAELEANETCATTGESAAVRDSAGGGYGFVPDFDWGSGYYPLSASLPNAYLVNNSMTGCGAYYANFSHADLSGSDLSGGAFYYADFSGANLAGVDLSGAKLEGATLADANFSGVNLTNVHAVEFNGCPSNLPAEWVCRGNCLIGPTAKLWGVIDLSGIDLSGLNLSNTVFYNAILVGADLSGANLSHSYMDGADLSGANLAGADLSYVEANNLDNCPATLPAGWVCVNKCLVGPTAIVSGNLSGQNLGGLDLTDTTFKYTNLTGVTFSGSTLTNVTWDQGLCPDGIAPDPSCCIHGSCCDQLIDVPASCSAAP